LVLKMSLPAGAAEAPVTWVAPLGGTQGEIVDFPQTLSIDPDDNVVIVSSGNLNGTSDGLLRRICSDGSTGSTPCPDGSKAWMSAGPFTAAAIQPALVDTSGDIYVAEISDSGTGLGVPFLTKIDKTGAPVPGWPATTQASGVCPYVD